ncbi:MAG: HEPN domain-containing protein [Deltaproteobacteria bacterium]|nr:HEPN domain-containing protein [Deltaproteobacteria bacterium]
MFLCNFCLVAYQRTFLADQRVTSGRHSGVRSLFHQNFVKPGLVDIELGQLYDRLFDNRQKGDYADLIRFDPDSVRPWYDEAQRFVRAIEDVTKRELTKE